MYLCLTGEMIDAQEALRISLVQRVTAPEALLDEAHRVAALIAPRDPSQSLPQNVRSSTVRRCRSPTV